MTVIPVAAALDRDVKVGPHDIHYHNGQSLHLDTRPAAVHVDALVAHGTVLVVMWHAGTVRGAVVYDRDDTVEEAA